MVPYRKKRELANWIRRRLGSPVVDVLLDSTQIDDCIDLACLYFGEHAGGIGNQESIILISPEQVYYDGTGNANQPAPVSGRWRTSKTDPTTAAGMCSPDASGSPTCPFPVDSAQPQYTKDRKYDEFSTMDKDGNACPVDSCLPGQNWCPKEDQEPQCFTEIPPTDPNAYGPFWVEGDTTGKPTHHGFIFKTVYDVPSDVIAVQEHLDRGINSIIGDRTNEEDNALFSPAYMLLQAGGSWGMQSPGSSVDNRWGFWMGGNGGFVDIVGYEIAMQYIQMFRTLFTVHMTAQLDSVSHKVRITPPPTAKGVIAFACTRRVANEYLYTHQCVMELSLAHAMINVGMNGSKYTGLTMPGGASFNGAIYLDRGDALREKMEAQVQSGMYAEPPDFMIG